MFKVAVPHIKKINEKSITTAKAWELGYGGRHEKGKSHTTQTRLEFTPQLVKEKLLKLMKNPKMPLKLVTLAGHTGDFSKALKESGFQVVHTDLAEKFVEAGRKKGLPSVKAFAHMPPKFKGVAAYVGFEIDPIHVNTPGAGHLLFLNALSNSKYGAVFVGTTEQWRPWAVTARAYACKAAGEKAVFKDVNTGEMQQVNFVRVYADKEWAKKMQEDIKVIKLLQGKPKTSVSRLQAATGLSKKRLLKSLRRIDFLSKRWTEHGPQPLMKEVEVSGVE